MPPPPMAVGAWSFKSSAGYFFFTCFALVLPFSSFFRRLANFVAGFLTIGLPFRDMGSPRSEIEQNECKGRIP